MQTGRIIKMLAGMTLAIGVGLWAVSAQATTLLQYNFDSLNGGGGITDISGNGHDLKFTSGSAALSPDTPNASGNSLSVANFQSNIGSPGTIDLGQGGQNKYTMEAAVKLSALPGSKMGIIEIGNTVNYSYSLLAIDAGGYVQIGNSGPGDPNVWQYFYYATDPTPLAIDQWYRIAATYTSGGVETLFVNGVQVAQTGVYGAFASGQDVAVVGTGWGPYTGLLDDVRLSNVVLSPDQFLGAVPEPSSLLLLGVGGLLLWRRRGTATS